MNETLTIGAPVWAADGEAGRLQYVVVDPRTGAVTDLIVERGRLRRHSLVVPAGWVQQADAHGLVVNARLAELEALPEYREVEFQALEPTARPGGYASEETLV